MEQKSEPQNISVVICYTSNDYIVVAKNYPSLRKDVVQPMLVINRKTGSIVRSHIFRLHKRILRNFSAFLGIVAIEKQNFVVFCDEAKPACTVSCFTSFEVSSMYFLSFKDEKMLKQVSNRKEIFSKIRDLNVLLANGFYFSHDYNLTRTLEFQKYEPISNFVWNNVFLKPLTNFPEWQTYLIQGFVQEFQIFLQGTKISYILISRRSHQKGGTRYFDRGINDNAHVANYVETEQILKINEYLMSDLQVRGNVPIFFQQKGLTTKIKLTRGYELTHQIYQKHIEKMIKSYQRVLWVNLLSEAKKGQLLLIKDLERHIKQDNNKNIKYLFYDFHKVTGHTYFDKVDQGIESLRQMKRSLKFYIYDTKKEEVIMRQWGVFRTNCLDCLDRTNFFQSKLAMITFEEMLSCFQIVFDVPLLKLMNDPAEQSRQIVNFRRLWANNGDKISYHYTGTGSTHTDIIRGGKRGYFGIFKHKYKSVARFYNQNFWDFYKMKLVDSLLNQKTSQIENITIPQQVNKRQAQFIQKQLLDVYIFSWKTPKKTPLSLPFFPNTSDLLVISLQETNDDQKWKQISSQSVDKQKYVLISQKLSNHNLLSIYIRKNMSNSVSNVQITKVKFKSLYNQYLSNKCAVLIRFDYLNTKLTFVGCQLEYGREYVSYRLQNLKDIHRYGFQEMKVGEKQSEPILTDDIVFVFGNMNTNVSASYKNSIVSNFTKNSFNTQTLDQRRLITEMLETDEFVQLQENLLQYRYYEEEPIKFPPTYKYYKNKEAFDDEVSGWPDRIWYSTDKKIICSKYGLVEQMREEHAPVFAGFQVEVEKVDDEAKQAVSQQVFGSFNGNEAEIDKEKEDYENEEEEKIGIYQIRK